MVLVRVLPQKGYKSIENGVVGVVAAVNDESPVEIACDLHVVAARADGLALGLEVFEDGEVGFCQGVASILIF